MLNKLSHVFFNSSIIIPYIFAIGVSSLMSKESIVGLIYIDINCISDITNNIYKIFKKQFTSI